MFMRFRRLLVGLSLPVLVQCGGRSGIPSGDAGEVSVPCTQDADCLDGNLCSTRTCTNHYCATVAHKDCDDQVFCTEDSCDEATGACVHQWRASDNDHDGYYAPLPGSKPGAPDACGDDCNDTQASVHPAALEQCDGYDNNCNGQVDEGTYNYSATTSPMRVTDDSFIDGGPTGLAYNGSYFGLAFTGSTHTSPYQGFFTGYDAAATRSVPLTNTTETSKDSFAGPLVWTGSVYATAWEVRGARGYDIRFNELDARGQKMGPDLRVSNGSGFSIQPTLLQMGDQYWVAWSDDDGGDVFSIFARKVSKDRELASDIVRLTDLPSDARTPTLIKSPTSYLLLYLSAVNRQIRGRMLDADMNPIGGEILISGAGASSYSTDWVADRFVVAWSLEGVQPGNAIWAAAIDANGTLIQGQQAITNGANFARTPNVLSLGDRFALAWADDRVSFGHYGIRMALYDPSLSASSDAEILAETTYDCIDPTLASGGHGLAMVYRERTYGRTGFPYFVGLGCDYFER
jgi:hypothetical protein